MLLWCIRTTTHTYNYIHKYNYNNYLRPAADAATKHLAERNNVVTIKICAVMLMYSLIECSDNYFKTSGSLWQNYI